MSHGHVLRALKEFGVVGTFKKLYKMRTLKFGRLVGVDDFGNHYYENTKDYPAGERRKGRGEAFGACLKGVATTPLACPLCGRRCVRCGPHRVLMAWRAGQHRWVEYAGEKSFYEVDASFVPPEWHGWLHCTTDETPTKVRCSGRWGETWGACDFVRFTTLSDTAVTVAPSIITLTTS